MSKPLSGLGGYTRALGQGLSMGWSDEAEAKTRSATTGMPYEQALAQVRNEYSQFAQDNPIGAPLMEFAGGIAPSIAAMFVPGGQAAGTVSGARTLGALGQAAKAIIGGRSTGQNVLRATGTGTATGAISGAGSTEGDRTIGAIFGGGTGALLAPVAQLAPALAGATYRRLGDRFRSGDNLPLTAPQINPPDLTPIEVAAARRMTKSLGDMTPQEMMQRINEDALLGVPSMPANANRGLLNTAEIIAQMPNQAANVIEGAFEGQRGDVRNRIVGQIRNNLAPTTYFDDLENLQQGMQARAKPLYDAARAVGAVDDPVILNFMQHPIIQDAYRTASRAADIRKNTAIALGEDPSEFELSRIMRPTGNFDPAAIQSLREMGIPENKITEYLSGAGDSAMEMAETIVPDVNTLHQIKVSLDNMVNSLYSSENKAIRDSAGAVEDLRDRFLQRFDEVVPEYAAARAAYAGDKQIENALTAGFNDYKDTPPEVLARMFSTLSDSEKQAYRTGSARKIWSTVMNPTQDRNFARDVINSPEEREKLRIMFPSQGSYDLFEAALLREKDLYAGATRVLSGSPTTRRTAGMREFTEDPLLDTASQFVQQGFETGLVNSVLNLVQRGTLSDDLAAKMAEWLTSNDPQKIAAVVQKLEQYQATAIPTFGGRRAASTGFVGGVQGMSGEAGLPIRDEGDEE